MRYDDDLTPPPPHTLRSQNYVTSTQFHLKASFVAIDGREGHTP
jgi:hypothetical protein